MACITTKRWSASEILRPIPAPLPSRQVSSPLFEILRCQIVSLSEDGACLLLLIKPQQLGGGYHDGDLRNWFIERLCFVRLLLNQDQRTLLIARWGSKFRLALCLRLSLDGVTLT